jgi:ADP-ribose pyrophosphatase YjhB (NUDIX family)
MVELGVRAILKNLKGEILLVKRVRGLDKGKWSLPGGQVEFKESAVGAIKREVKEELDLDFFPQFLTYADDLFSSPETHYLTLFFAGRYQGKIRVKSDEISKHKFFSMEKIRQTKEIGLGHKEVLTRII